jgi:hypothetical protein
MDEKENVFSVGLVYIGLLAVVSIIRYMENAVVQDTKVVQTSGAALRSAASATKARAGIYLFPFSKKRRKNDKE